MAAVRFAVVGVANTALGLAIIYLMMWAGMGAVLANFTGYSIGFFLSFVLNGLWTFRRPRLTRGQAWRFAAAVAVGYLANLAALQLSTKILLISPAIGQIFGVVTYTASTFLLFRYFVFKEPQSG